jgi:hypothetical protein
MTWFNFNVKSTGETFNTNQRQTIELIKKKADFYIGFVKFNLT